MSIVIVFSSRLANMNRPAAVEIKHEAMRFLITHNPTNATLNKFTEVRGFIGHRVHSYLLWMSPTKSLFVVCQELKKFEVDTLVRVCDATYDKAPVEKEGIQVLVSIAFPGLSLPSEVIRAD